MCVMVIYVAKYITTGGFTKEQAQMMFTSNCRSIRYFAPVEHVLELFQGKLNTSKTDVSTCVTCLREGQTIRQKNVGAHIYSNGIYMCATRFSGGFLWDGRHSVFARWNSWDKQKIYHWCFLVIFGKWELVSSASPCGLCWKIHNSLRSNRS